MPMLPPGQRDTRISFQRNGAARSALGGKAAADWAELFSRLAKVTWGSSAERRSAAVEGAIQTATFRTLADSETKSITAKDRIVMADGLTFDVTGIAPIGSPVPYEIEFTCTANRG